MIALIRCAYFDFIVMIGGTTKTKMLPKLNWTQMLGLCKARLSRKKFEPYLYLSHSGDYHRCLSGWHGHWQTKSTVYFLSPMNWPSLTTASTEGSVMTSSASSSTVAATIVTAGRGPKRLDWPAVSTLRFGQWSS